MSLEIQFKIKENINYLHYLRTHSYWYKILNRNSNKFKKFEEEVKREYKLNKMDRLEKAIDTFDMLEKVLSTLS